MPASAPRWAWGCCSAPPPPALKKNLQCAVKGWQLSLWEGPLETQRRLPNSPHLSPKPCSRRAAQHGPLPCSPRIGPARTGARKPESRGTRDDHDPPARSPAPRAPAPPHPGRPPHSPCTAAARSRSSSAGARRSSRQRSAAGRPRFMARGHRARHGDAATRRRGRSSAQQQTAAGRAVPVAT